jgi:hypothetical protein
MQAPQIIYRTDHLTVVLLENDTDTVFVTFNEVGLNASGTEFWGREVFAKNSISVIGFVSAKPNWYPPGDMAAALEAARAHIGGRRVVTYGHSQGGYGALKFGGALSASVALAFCPQWSIVPEDVASFDRRFIGFYKPDLRNGSRIEAGDLPIRSFLFVDEGQPQDWQNAKPILSLSKSVTKITMPFSGHASIRILTESGQGGAFVRTFLVADDPGAQALRNMVRQGRSRSQAYRDQKLERLTKTSRRHPTYFTGALIGFPDGISKTLILIKAALYAGDKQRAQDLLDSLSDEQLLQIDFIYSWEVFRRCGFDHGERRLGPLFPRKYPDSTFARLHGVNSLIKVRATSDAITELETLSERPDAAANLSNLLMFSIMLNRFDWASGQIAKHVARKTISGKERLQHGLMLAEALQERRRFKDVEREVVQLTELCRSDYSSALRVAELLIFVRQYEKALRLLDGIDVPAPDACLKRLGQARCWAAINPKKAKKLRKALLGERDGGIVYWKKLMALGKPLIDCDATIVAGETYLGLATTPDDLVHGHHRLTLAHLENKDPKKALESLRYLLASAAAKSSRAEEFADLARKAGDVHLALGFARAWFGAAPESIMAHLRLCEALANCRERTALKPAILDACAVLEGGADLGESGYARLLDAAYAVDFLMVQKVARLAVRAFPENTDFARHISKDPFVNQFYGGPAPAETSPPARAKGLSRVLGLFGLGAT